MNNKIAVSLLAAVAIFIGSCSKWDPNKPIGGQTDIPLTQVGNESSVYVTMDNSNVLNLDFTIIDNQNGDVTYKGSLDLNGNPDSAFIATGLSLALPQFTNVDGVYDIEFDMRITSDGIQESTLGEPWTIIRYSDPVGTRYPATAEDGTTIYREVTHKSTEDDFPIGFLYIKTNETEFSSNEFVNTVRFFTNHKFGLVGVEMDLETGNSVSLEILPWDVLP